MGNAASCAPSIIISGSSVAKVLSSDGKMQIYTRPVRAAELMLENPGQFLCNSSTLRVGHRIHGLLADEELELRRFYFFLPMELLYSVLTYEEMSALTYRASKALKHGSFNNLSKIFPVCIFPSESKRTEGSDRDVVLEPIERYSKQRSWRPALETIVETPCRL
ncbi:hypothetical protein EUGRSUZ_B00987 [Eucalyptus grandis]|uniref:Uncharacterized protein n=3 Tax=Eucalyptus TaxID=3932 RepID=A0ACC3LNS4_EUCGR|nr:hypothetical protein EUGRSUZ_B00987 [Eucalyptus grandis]